MFKLIGTDGTQVYSFDLSPGTATIGRKQEWCDIHVPDRTVSRRHAEVEVIGEYNQFFVTDLGSHNGTTVNGHAVTGRVEVSPGDTITFGQTEFKIADDAAAETSTSRPTATKLSDIDPGKSVYLSIDEALKPLPSKVTDLPQVFPALSQMARMLVLPEPREVMLEHSLALVAKVIPAERLAVLFTGDTPDNIYAAATLVPSGKDLGDFTLSTTIVNDILEKKSSVLVGNPEEDERLAQQQSIIMSGLKSAMAVPLFDEGRVLGILYADTTNPLHQYTDEYLRLFATFGNIIASRLTNYTLLEERQEKQVIEAELRKAGAIQKKLLVDCCPQIDGYESHAYQEQSRMVGGDLYDMFILPDGRYIFMVADVSGKGMGAALLMSNILASFRILYGSKVFDLSRAVSRVSTQLFESSNMGDFATLFVGLLDTNTHQLLYVNAGHNPPYLVSKDGSTRELEPSGFMIGAFDYGEWPVKEETMESQDTLVIFSDGVTEAVGKEGQFGEARLKDVIVAERDKSPEQMAAALGQKIGEFVQDEPQSDDITMLLVKRTK
jgi:sigma-B regulation protein RsbU (phosphoserine phosphatase)